MHKKASVTEIALLVLGLILGCSWFPRGILGVIGMIRVVFRLPVPQTIIQFLDLWSYPVRWYSQQVFLFDHPVGTFLLALPNCLCGIVAIAIIGLVIFLFVRARQAGAGETT